MAKNPLNYILYVDDEPDMRILVQALLENNGIKVGLCENGLTVLESALDNKPQMILLDVMMEGLDGIAIMKELKADSRLSDIPVVFITAKTNEQDIKNLIDMGAIGVIAKPFDLIAITDQIKSLWEKAS